MQLRHLLRPSIALLAVLAGCATGTDRQQAPVKVDELMTWVERVHIEAERARDAISDSFDRLNVLAAGRFEGDSAAVTYARFVQSIDVADEQAKRFAAAVAPMLESAGPVFEHWQADVALITSDRLRQRGEMRFQIAKERYDAIAKAAVPAQTQLDGFVQSLRDHALFLGHDLNASAIDDIQEEVKIVAATALELDRNLESTMSSSRAYAEQSSLPLAAPSGR
tara:strand:+ start:88727 stop:89395 length:669 start_codon:yes stop_codon:yes gene_type:complete